jgi:hypothetical protein
MEVVNTTSTTDPVNMYNYLNSYVMNPTVLIIIILIVLLYYAFSSSLGPGNLDPYNLDPYQNYNTSSSGSFFGYIIVLILVMLILVNAFQYFFSINVTAYIQGLFTPKPTVDIVVDESTGEKDTIDENDTTDEDNTIGKDQTTGKDHSTGKDQTTGKYHSTGIIKNQTNNKDQSSYKPAPAPEIKFKKQVFNIPGNYYTYNDAKAMCSAYGADLATYEQLEQAYNKGAEWCNYGWSANQLALFPTQKKTYDILQGTPGHENDCGRPGINGGYIANPNVKFGVNCYGNKPKIRSDEEELMKTSKPYPQTEQDIAFQKKVDQMRNNLDQILLSPFNRDTWGAF